MLKIVKGLKPFVEDGVSTYTNDRSDRYVRIKTDDEDFCIAAHDYTRNDKCWFIWDDVMKSMEVNELNTLTKKQAQLCIKHLQEVNDKLEEIGGDILKNTYWTTTEYDPEQAWSYDCGILSCSICHFFKNYKFRVRPIIDLSTK